MDKDKSKEKQKGEVLDMVSILQRNIIHKDDKDDIVTLHKELIYNKKERAKVYRYYDENYEETNGERKIMEAMTRRRRRRR